MPLSLVARGHVALEVLPLQVLTAIARADDHTGAVAGADEGVGDTRRAMDEVPWPETALLALNDENALALQDEEILLHRLAVVMTRGARRENTDREASGRLDVFVEVGAPAQDELVRLEDANSAEVIVVDPSGVARVDDEPPGADGRNARRNGFETCFFDHWNLARVQVSRQARRAASRGGLRLFTVFSVRRAGSAR
jgi:hypothetical protein